MFISFRAGLPRRAPPAQPPEKRMHRPLSNLLAVAIAVTMLAGAGLRGQNAALPDPGGRGRRAPRGRRCCRRGRRSRRRATGSCGKRRRRARCNWASRRRRRRCCAALLESPETPGAVKNRLVLELAAAVMDQGRLADADQALARFTGPRTSDYHLRAGLIAAYRRQADAARQEAEQMKIDDLPAPERGWYRFLEGMIADLTGDPAGGIRPTMKRLKAPSPTCSGRASNWNGSASSCWRAGPPSRGRPP